MDTTHLSHHQKFRKIDWRSYGPLLIHPAAELFPRPSETELKELAEDIKVNGLRVPIAVCKSADGKTLAVVDGVSRLDAMALTGLLNINDDDELCIGKEAVRFTAVATDPYEAAISLNIHRRHLTNEQKRELVEKVLKARPQISDRQIAKQTKTSPTTVGKIRKKSETTGDVSNLDTRTDTKGRNQPSTKPKKSASVPPKSQRGSVSAEDIALKDFSARAAELIRVTKKNNPERFANTSLSFKDLRALGHFFLDLANVCEKKRKAEHDAKLEAEVAAILGEAAP